MKALGGRILDSIDFKIRFPMPKGTYKFTNLTFSGYIFPPFVKLIFKVDLQFLAKIERKKWIVSSSAVIYGKLN